MRKALSIALFFLTAAIIVPGASADPTLGERIIAQEQATGPAEALGARSEALNQEYGLGTAGEAAAAPRALQPTAVQQVIAQERARAGDPALFGPFSTPVQIVGSSDEFDLRDAGIGGAVGLAFAFLVAAGVAFRNGSRHRTPEAAPAES